MLKFPVTDTFQVVKFTIVYYSKFSLGASIVSVHFG